MALKQKVWLIAAQLFRKELRVPAQKPAPLVYPELLEVTEILILIHGDHLIGLDLFASGNNDVLLTT